MHHLTAQVSMLVRSTTGWSQMDLAPQACPCPTLGSPQSEQMEKVAWKEGSHVWEGKMGGGSSVNKGSAGPASSPRDGESWTHFTGGAAEGTI